MKKFIKWFFITIISVIILLVAAAIVIPIVFKPQLLRLAKDEINKQVIAKVEFSDFKVSVFKGFPDVYIGLMNLSVVGIEEFEGDTLVAFDEFSVTVDIKSVLAMKDIQVKSVLLKKPVMTAKITKEGKANWDIAPVSDEEEVPEEASDEPMELNVALKKFEVRNGDVRYIDDESNMKALISNLNFLLSGDLGLSYSDLNIVASIEKLNFYMDGIRYMKDVKADFAGIIGADLDNFAFTFKENVLNLNKIDVKFDGKVAMPTDDIDVDVTFASGKTDFKSLLSMVPAIYMQDFEGLQTSGKLTLEGWVKGTMTETTMPSAHINLEVENARFQYPDLPKSAENIAIQTKIFYDGVDEDKTTVDVSKFHIELGGNPFDMSLSIRNPMTDMYVAGVFKGIIDFNSLTDVVPLDDMKISGVLESNIDFAGLMSYIEKEQYEKFKADGTLRLKGFEFSSPDLPQGLRINETTLNFSPKYVQLASFDAVVGRSDMQMNGRLENFIPFVFADETIRGTLNFTSRLLDANEFLGDSEEVEEEQDTTAMSVIEVPRNVDFVLTSNISKVKYDKLDIENIKGQIVVRDEKVLMKDVGMNLLKGSMVLSGEYNTQNMAEPKIDFLMDIKNFDIPSAFNSISMIQEMAPQLKNVTGNISTKLTLNSLLDSTMGPVLSSVNAKGRFASQNIAIVGSPLFTKVGDLLKNDDISNPRLNNFDAQITVTEGRIYIDPFDTGIKDIKMNFGGDMGLDQTLNYKAKIEMPRSKLGAASEGLNVVNQQAAKLGITMAQSDKVKLNLLITGTSTDPKVRLDMGEAAQGVKEQVKEQVQQMIDETVDKAKEEARQKAKEQADKLIRDAEIEAEKIRSEARVLADKIRKEADAKAKKVEDEAKGKGPIAQQAAKKTAEQIRKEGDEAAKKVIREADAKAQALIDKAKAEAAKIEAGA